MTPHACAALPPVDVQPMDRRTPLCAPSAPTTYRARTTFSLPGVRTGRAHEADGDRVLTALGDLEVAELVAVVGRHPRRCVRHELGEVVEHAGLVDVQVGELADPGRVVGRPLPTDDPGGVGRVRVPEADLHDPVGLLGDPSREAEGLEGLDAARLDAVRLADRQPTLAAVDDPRRDVRELRELGRGDHAGGSRPDDEDVDLVGELVGPVEAHACGGLDARITRDVPVVVELHGTDSPDADVEALRDLPDRISSP